MPVANLITRPDASAVYAWPATAVFAALPTLGLVAGPSYAALIFGLAIVGVAVQGRVPVIDRQFGALAAAFALWCWASVAWSLDPPRSAAAALQMTAIFAGGLVFLAGPSLSGEATDRLFRVLFVATLVGGGIFLVDRAIGYPLLTLFKGDSQAWSGTKYNRGIDHLVLIAWPQLAFWARRRDWRRGAVLAVAVVVVEAAGLSLAGKVAAAAGLPVLALGFVAPRAVPLLLGGVTAAYVIGLPLALRALAEWRMALAPYLQHSALHRLEIWDVMTARVLDHPLLGWGFGTGGALPITAEELSRFVEQQHQGIYPHNQWLGIWVETGAIGAVIALAFSLLVLVRMQRLSEATRPFAYAAFAAALVISSVNFEVKTDSWWAAMLACVWLLIVVDSRVRDFAMPMTRS